MHHLRISPRLLVAFTTIALCATALSQGGGKVDSGEDPRQDPFASCRMASGESIQAMLEATDDPSRRPPRRFAVEAGMLILGMTGDGSTLHSGPWADTLQAIAVDLCARQWQNGSFYDGASKGPRCATVSQAVATLALLELTAVSVGAPEAKAELVAQIRDAAARATDALMQYRRDDGSWVDGYSVAEPGDLRTTAWAAMVLATAQRTGTGDVDDAAVDAALGWLAGQLAAEEMAFDEPAQRGLLAQVALAHLFAGKDPRQVEALAPLLDNIVPADPPKLDQPWSDGASFGWIGLAAYQLGGPLWRRWQPHLDAVKEAMLEDRMPSETSRLVSERVSGQGLRILGVQAYWRYGNLLRPRKK